MNHYDESVTSRSPGVRPELTSESHGHASTQFRHPTCPHTSPKSRRTQCSFENQPISISIYFYLQSCAQGNGKGGSEHGILSEVTLDQTPRMTLYTTRCGKEGWLATTINQDNLTFQDITFLCISINLAINQYNELSRCQAND
ncbi:hypothetical protein N665_2566s0001 [Sinapis alba]|nr:hypothetical protein N665_2566s0001 [Sinapis alba]